MGVLSNQQAVSNFTQNNRTNFILIIWYFFANKFFNLYWIKVI